MSSNHNHNNNTIISLANYEEYFLMYIDDELTAAEKVAVEDFIAAYPDKKAELELLGGTKLAPETVSLPGKEALLADSMLVNSIDENLLLYIDDELDAAGKAAFEKGLQQDAALQMQHRLLLQTKLDASETLIYPYKEALYKQEQRRIAPYWLRVAAAVILIAGAGTLGWYASTDIAAPAGTVAVKTPAVTAPQTKAPLPATPAAINAAATTINNEPIAAAEKKTILQQSGSITVATKQALPISTEGVAPTEAHRLLAAVDVPATALTEVPSQNTNNQAVTSVTPATYNNKGIQPTTVPVAANADIALTDNERGGGSLKGFLRKATRFIERTTNVNPINEDDELLIGALAIKVK